MQGRKTGPKPQFAAEDVVAAAIDLGVADFSLSQVAARLGVRAPALYRVVATREEIVALAFARIASEIPAPPEDLCWTEVLAAWVDACWSLFERYAGLARAVLDHPASAGSLGTHLEAYQQALLTSGFPGTADDAAFLLDFAGDTAIVTHIGITNLSRLPTDDDWLPELADGRTRLDRKVALIAAAFASDRSLPGAGT